MTSIGPNVKPVVVLARYLIAAIEDGQPDNKRPERDHYIGHIYGLIALHDIDPPTVTEATLFATEMAYNIHRLQDRPLPILPADMVQLLPEEKLEEAANYCYVPETKAG